VLPHAARSHGLAPGLDRRRAGAEEVAVVKAAAGHAELVGAAAFVALPEPFEGGWGRGVGGGGGGLSAVEGALVDRGGGGGNWGPW
jgi:hypothetical protein